MEKLHLILNILKEKNAEHIQVIDLRGTGNLGEYAIVADASNPRLLKALRDYVCEALESHNYSIHHLEGNSASDWLLIDAFDVIVHLFLEPTRQFYRLDELYIDRWIKP